MNFRGLVWVCAVAGLACLGNELRAAISVTLPSGSPIITFNTNPPAADISQRSVAGTSAAPNDAITLNTLVQTNEASMITLQLDADAGNPPANAGAARWSSSGQYAQTRPAGNAATLMMATFRNDGEWDITSPVFLGYQLTVVAPAAEQVGHLVYYSLTGLANSWVQLPHISNLPDDNVAGTYSRVAMLDFEATPWPVGSLLYILWADDNGSGTPDTAMQIDNLQLAMCQPPLVVSPPADATVEQCRGTNFIVQLFGCRQRPIIFQWYKDGAPIDPNLNPSAATTNLLISNAQPADAGTYVCRATNPFSSATSAPTTLTVMVDNQPPQLVSALESNGVVTITYSEPMHDVAGDAAMYTVCNVDLPLDWLHNVNASLSSDFRTVTLVTTGIRPGAAYQVRVGQFVGDRCKANPIGEDATIPLHREVPLLRADDVTQWRYNQDGVDLGTAWRQPWYDDSHWFTGVAALGVEDRPPADPPLRTVLSLTSTNLGGAHIPTYYFRTHFKFLGGQRLPSARLKIRTAFDDYAYVYINGVEVYRDSHLGAVGSPELPFSAYAGGNAREVAWSPYMYIPLTNTVSGDNVLAVQLKQQTAVSGDVYMAVELVAELTQVYPPPTLCAVREFAPDGRQRLQIIWPCSPTPIAGLLLQSADDVEGPWTTIAGATSPYLIALGAARKFYRLYKP